MVKIMKKVIIIGAGGQGRVISDIVAACDDEVLGFLDDKCTKLDFDGVLLGKTEEALKFVSDSEFIIAIGNNEIRQKVAEKLLSLKAKFYTAIHPTAVISKSATVGEGTVVMPFAVINAAATVGEHCIINTGAVVEHDNVIEDYVHLSPRVALGGTVRVNKRTHVGIGAVVKNNVCITGDCVIGAGAVVVKDIVEKGTYVGVPARKK